MPETTTALDRQGILARLPHQGDSCLLDALLHWDAHRIVCESSAHRLRRNPYRIAGKLPAISAAEFAAQSIALHARLKADATGNAPRRSHGYLASVRNLTLMADSLEGYSGTLRIEAEELSAERFGMLYSFNLQHQDTMIAQGRATIALAPGTL